MCKYDYIQFTKCGCYQYRVIECGPRASVPLPPADLDCEEFERVDWPDLDLSCKICSTAWDNEDEIARHRGNFAKIAREHNHIKTYRDEDNAKWAACEAWVMDVEPPLPAIEEPDLSLDFDQSVEITPPPELEEAQTRTTIDRVRVWDYNRDMYDLTSRNVVLSSSQRDAMASIGYPGIKRFNIVSRRMINVRRHLLSKDQRAALRRAGHTNLRILTVVTKRGDHQHLEGTQSIVTNSHKFTAEQRAALRKAGHGNLRTLVIKGR